MAAETTVDELRDGMLEQPRESSSSIRLQLVLLGAFRFTEAIAWTSIFPYVYFMIESFPGTAEADIAFYAGLLVAVFTFCEFLSAMVWAKISDLIGRRYTLLIGILGGVASAVVFGLSKSIVMAVVSRAVGGLMNPNVGIVQTCVGELVKDKAQQGSITGIKYNKAESIAAANVFIAKAFATVSFLRGIGSLIGPVLGGLLADPVKHYPSIFRRDSVWDHYPYLLSNLVVALLSTLGLLLGILFLTETHPLLAQKPDLGLKVGKSIIWALKESVKRKSFSYSRLRDPVAEAPLRGVLEAEDADAAALELQSLQSDSSQDALDSRDVLDSGDALDNGRPSQKAFTLQVVLQILSVSLLAFHKVSSDVIIPTFLAFPPVFLQRDPTLPLQNNIFQFSSGFGLSTQNIGLILLTQACIAIIAQATAIPFTVRRYSALKTYRAVLCIFPVLYLFTPFTARLSSPFSIVALLLDLWVKVLLSSTGYICSAILITNTAPSRDLLASINGAAAAFSCLARSFGPLLSGKLFGWGVQAGYIGVSFWTLAATALVGAGVSRFLTDHP